MGGGPHKSWQYTDFVFFFFSSTFSEATKEDCDKEKKTFQQGSNAEIQLFAYLSQDHKIFRAPQVMSVSCFHFVEVSLLRAQTLFVSYVFFSCCFCSGVLLL
jgi:hypothetical protein